MRQLPPHLLVSRRKLQVISRRKLLLVEDFSGLMVLARLIHVLLVLVNPTALVQRI